MVVSRMRATGSGWASPRAGLTLGPNPNPLRRVRPTFPSARFPSPQECRELRWSGGRLVERRSDGKWTSNLQESVGNAKSH